MLKKIIYTASIILGSFNLFSQNLVPNPSFEAYNLCPNISGVIDTQFTYVKNWFCNTKFNGSGYYNRCATHPNTRVPANPLGYCLPHQGDAYVSIILYDHWRPIDHPSDTGQRSYLSVKLLSPLIQDSVYFVSLYVSMSDSGLYSSGSLVATSDLGIYFSNVNTFYPIERNIPVTPQVQNPVWRFLDDTLGWMNVFGYYKATGGEQYITIGNFTPFADTHLKMVRLGSNPNSDLSRGYIDDVSINPTHLQPIVQDTSFCLGDSISWEKRPTFNTCLWNDGDTSTHKYLKQAATYWVTHTSGNVSITDTIKVLALANNSNHTQYFCAAQTLTLQAGNAKSYVWNTLSTSPSINIMQPGTYWVTRFNPNCAVTDTFTVIEHPLPNLNVLNDTLICFDEGQQLLINAGSFQRYTWQPSGDTTATFLITNPQTVNLTVTDNNNCTNIKQLTISSGCPDFIYVPTAFSPNSDGINEVFLPVTRNLESYELSIVNRIGELIFTTTNPQQGWDGKNVPIGVYSVHITYKPQGKSEKHLVQSVTLLR